MNWIETDITSLNATNNRVIVDVREIDEYTAGHIPGAVNIPLSLLTESLHSIPQAETIHVVCQVGGRSARACEFLSQQDQFSSTQFINVIGGTGAWILEGHDIVVGNEPN
jgi:rhodanese-related sulfurtransferase